LHWQFEAKLRPDAVTIRREFVRALGTFQHRLLAVAGEHEVGDAPNVEVRDHDGEPIRRPYIDS
jgi:hypothetical protein